MKEKEFLKLKVGDKVKIVSKKEGDYWNDNGKMDKWLGEVMTIRGVIESFGCRTTLRMVEDEKEFSRAFGNDGWAWHPHMIECKVENEDNPTIVKHLVKDDKVIVKLSNGKVGVAKCAPEDAFDIAEGTKLAIDRAYGKVAPYKTRPNPKVKEVKRHAKVGEWIKIVEPCDNEPYKKGDVFQVKEQLGLFNAVRTYLPKGAVGNTSLGRRDGYYYIHDREYVVLEGYEPPVVKEVKRPAMAGEWIKIVKPFHDNEPYKKGDVFQVKERNELSTGVRTYLPKGAVGNTMCGFLGGYNYIYDSEYVVLEGYEPEKK